MINKKTTEKTKNVYIHFIDKEKYESLLMGSPVMNYNGQIFFLGSPNCEDEEFCGMCAHELGHSASNNFEILSLFRSASFIIETFKKIFRILVVVTYNTYQKKDSKIERIILLIISIFLETIYFILYLPEIILMAIPYRCEENKADEFCFLCGYGEWLKQFLYRVKDSDCFSNYLFDLFQHPSCDNRRQRFCKLNNMLPIYKDYIFMDHGKVLIKYLGYNTNLTIPYFTKEVGNGKYVVSYRVKNIDLYKATIIHANAFANSSIQNVIGEEIEIVETKAFYYTKYLEKVKLPKVSKISSSAFCNSNLKEIVLSNNLKIIEEQAFSNCEYLQYIYQFDVNNLEKIAGNAFDNDKNLVNDQICVSMERQNSMMIKDNIVYVSDLVFASDNKITKLLFVPASVRFLNINCPISYIVNKTQLTFNQGISVQSVNELINDIKEEFPFQKLILPNVLEIDDNASFSLASQYYLINNLSYKFKENNLKNGVECFILNTLIKNNILDLLLNWINIQETNDLFLSFIIIKDLIDNHIKNEINDFIVKLKSKNIKLEIIEIESKDFSLFINQLYIRKKDIQDVITKNNNS